MIDIDMNYYLATASIHYFYCTVSIHCPQSCPSIDHHRLLNILSIFLTTGRLLLRSCGYVECRYADCLLRQMTLMHSAHSMRHGDVSACISNHATLSLSLLRSN